MSMHRLSALSLSLASCVLFSSQHSAPLSAQTIAPTIITSCVSKLFGVSRIVAAPIACNAAVENVVMWNQQGPQGAPGLVYRGAFNINTFPYNKNDIVTYQGSTYVALGTAGGFPPNSSLNDVGREWALLVPQGATGPDGPTGPAGIAGPSGPTGPVGGQLLSANSLFPATLSGTSLLGTSSGLGTMQPFTFAGFQLLELKVPSPCTPSGFSVTELGAYGTSTATVYLAVTADASGAGKYFAFQSCKITANEGGLSTCTQDPSYVAGTIPAGASIFIEGTGFTNVSDFQGAHLLTSFVCK